MSIVVDCDPGLDDALALLALAELTGRGALRVGCVTAVAGNAPVELTARNAAFVLDRSALRGTPVLAGAGAGRRPPIRHGPDGLGGLAPPAPAGGGVAGGRWSAGGVLELARRLGRPDTTILALGPLSNLAGALDAAPAPPGARVVAMGGSTGGSGEFNFAHDRSGAARVLERGLRVTVVPIEVTGQVSFAPAEIEAIGRAAANPLVGALLRASRERAGAACPVHDAVALIALAHPELVRTARGRGSVAPDGAVTLEPDPDGTCEVVEHSTRRPSGGG